MNTYIANCLHTIKTEEELIELVYDFEPDENLLLDTAVYYSNMFCVRALVKLGIKGTENALRYVLIDLNSASKPYYDRDNGFEIIKLLLKNKYFITNEHLFLAERCADDEIEEYVEDYYKQQMMLMKMLTSESKSSTFEPYLLSVVFSFI